MEITGLFLLVAALVVLASTAIVFAPLWRGGSRDAARASYDMQVYRDQLGGVEADLARGVLTPEEAEATRTEVSRRLLAAADAEAAETVARPAPRRLTRIAAPLLMLGAVAAAAGLYAAIGAPGFSDQPLALRQAGAAATSGRPSQAEAEAMVAARGRVPPEPSEEDAALIARLEAVMAERSDDPQGHRLLARSLAALGRFAEARAAQARVVELGGDAPDPADLLDLAELMVLAAGGYVSPEAEALLARGLAETPNDPSGRYFSGLALVQAGRADLAYPIWSRLLDEGPADAPWVAAIRAEIGEVARLAGEAPPGPTAAEVEAAAALPAEDREAMIAGMVDRLAARLAAEGGPPEDWARLITSLGVLGRQDEAGPIRDEALTVFAADPQALAAINEAARAAGLPE